MSIKRKTVQVERGIRLSNEIHMARREAAGQQNINIIIIADRRRTVEAVGLAAAPRCWLVARWANQCRDMPLCQSECRDKDNPSRVSAPSEPLFVDADAMLATWTRLRQTVIILWLLLMVVAIWELLGSSWTHPESG